jgi:hypothetical protein
LIPAFAKQAVYFAKAWELAPPPFPPARGALVIDGFGVAFVAALAGSTLAPTIATAIRATALLFFVKVMSEGYGNIFRHQGVFAYFWLRIMGQVGSSHVKSTRIAARW